MDHQLDKIEQKNRKIGIAVSIGLHVLLLVAFLFVTAWKEPNPPLPEYGIQLNFGLDQAGSGEVQPETPVESTNETEETEQPEAVEETVEATEDSPAEQTTESTAEAEEVVDNADNGEVVTQEESPVSVEEKTASKPQKETKEQAETEQKQQKQAEPTKEPNPDALFPPKSQSQGNKPTESGDQGDKDGSVDSRALMGNQGGGGGSQLDMAGWTWDRLPKPNDTSDENGRIKFKIEVNSDGYVNRVITLETTVSPDVVKIYKDEVQRLTFSKTAGNTAPAPISTGTITFLIRSK